MKFFLIFILTFNKSYDNIQERKERKKERKTVYQKNFITEEQVLMAVEVDMSISSQLRDIFKATLQMSLRCRKEFI